MEYIMADNKENSQSLDNDSITSIFNFKDSDALTRNQTTDEDLEDEEKEKEELLSKESDENPQEESDSDTTEDNVVDSAEEGTDKVEATDKADDEKSDDFKALEARLAETQKWGKVERQKAAELQKKVEALVAEGTIDKEAFDSLKIEEDDLASEVREQFEIEFPIIQRFMKANGEDAEEYALAFDTMSGYDASLKQAILELPREERIQEIISKGKAMVDDYKIMKEHKGNLGDVFNAIKKEAVKAYIESAKNDVEAMETESAKTETASSTSRNLRPKLKQAGTEREVVEEDTSLSGILFGR